MGVPAADRRARAGPRARVHQQLRADADLLCGPQALDEMPQYAFDVPSYSAVRTDRYLYVRWYERERPLADREYELYDLVDDPYQLTNLLATPEGRAATTDVVAALDARLNVLAECSGASCR